MVVGEGVEVEVEVCNSALCSLFCVLVVFLMFCFGVNIYGVLSNSIHYSLLSVPGCQLFCTLQLKDEKYYEIFLLGIINLLKL